ncbi:FHA domain-containing protein [Streptomyces longwoodensis]|uniref:FHA domain-containing protein n=1 Tax=Streptomyces longwoodensis TaxID=68231 RepID=UPI0037977711
MQIRLTVVDPLGPPASEARGRAASRDVLVTAPAGTALAAVASALATAVSGETSASGGAVVLYAGVERLDVQRCTLGEPPLVDGAVLSLGAPADPEPHPEVADAPARLDVVAGPDAGGVHLLHGGQVRVGRSADADVPLDDPDVSRLHCAVTLAADGRVTVADLGSTNGTTLDGTRVPARPVRFAPGALLRIGESTLRLAPPGGPGTPVPTTPDGEGHVRVACPGATTGDAGGDGTRKGAVGQGAPGGAPGSSRRVSGRGGLTARVPEAHPADDDTGAPAGPTDPSPTGHGTPRSPAGPTGHGYGTGGWAGPAPTRSEAPTGSEGPYEPGTAPRGERGGPAPHPGPTVPGQGGAPSVERHGGAAEPLPGSGAGAPDATHAGRSGLGPFEGLATDIRNGHASADAGTPYDGPGRKPTPLRGTDAPPPARRRGGLSAWARRLTGGGRGDAPGTPDEGPYDVPAAATAPEPSAVVPGAPETWPDPATLLLTALGPGPRLWERGPGHPEALTVRLGTADRAAPDGSGVLPAVPVTTDLREVGALGLAGPRERLSGLARAVLAQLVALHSPDTLEIVLVSTDRARSTEERAAEWAWLGWLPHLRPAHGQDCRLLLAHDREQATARLDELLRRLDAPDEPDAHRSGRPAPSGPGRSLPGQRQPRPAEDAEHAEHAEGAEPADTASPATHQIAHPGAHASTTPARRPSWALADGPAGRPAGASAAPHGHPGPRTVLVVDGDPGGADLREAVARLSLDGPAAGIHLLCLAETASASPASPVTETYEAACAAVPAFRHCGAVVLLSGDVATALRLLRVVRAGGPGSEPPGPVGHGTVGAVDAVSPAWAERFARALAPLRPDGAGERHPRVAAPLPASARLLDELGLARATPASLMARWADAADDPEALGGRAVAVVGAGPRGPVGVDLAGDGPHLLVEGPPGSGRTELLRAVVASLAAAERPDRLGIVLIDGRDSVGKGGAGHGDGLRVCTDVPHVTTHLTANDPVRMREFAQSLSAELKRRAELVGRVDFAEWHRHRAVADRIGPQRGPGGGAADLDGPPSSTLRLRPGAAARPRTEPAPALPRLVVVVDDLDALVSPALGSPGRPAAGSVMRALEAVARDGERLGVHLVAAAGPGGRTAESEPSRRATLRIALDAPGSGTDEPAPGRGRLTGADGRVTPFQGGRVTGRIPRTATVRPTVVPLDWRRMGDPPTRRPVRELGNGPTDLALLASALERAAREVAAAEVPSLL